MQNSFSGTDRRLMPLQLYQIDRSPFFDTSIMIPFCHASDTFSQTLLNRFLRTLALAARSAFNMSADTLFARCSVYLRCVIAVSFSVFVIRPRFISMLKLMSSMTAVQFVRIMFSPPFHLIPLFHQTFPSLAFTTIALLVNRLVSRFVILYIVLVSIFPAAVFASLAILSV